MYQSAIRYRYQRINPNLPLMPVIPITLSYGDKIFNTIALVDSGSSSTVISTEVAKQLGIKWETLKKYSGGSVAGEYSFRTVEGGSAIINKAEIPLSFDIVKTDLPFLCLLGQDFFFHAKITFERGKKSFEIQFRTDIN
jgi:hypothetical protein